jgi:hypothetical protein
LSAPATRRAGDVEYPYLDERGELLFQVVYTSRGRPHRHRCAADSCQQHGTRGRPKDGWCWASTGIRRVLFRLPEVLAAASARRRIVVAHDEARALELARLDVDATAVAGGVTAAWLPEYSTALSGSADVVLLVEDDETKRDRWDRVAAAIARIATVRVLKASTWTAAGGTRAKLEQLVAAAPAWSSPSTAEASSSTSAPALPYAEDASGLYHLRTRAGKGGAVTERELLCNFSARIVAEVEKDDGSDGGEPRRWRKIEVKVAGQPSPQRVDVERERFDSIAWSSAVRGAILEPGRNVRELVRHAIEKLSAGAPWRRVHTHTGWIKLEDGSRVYLSAGAVIGASGPVEGLGVELDRLRRFELPPPPSGEDLVRAVRASLEFTSAGPEAVTVPIYCAVWRSTWDAPDFGLWLSGQTESGKSELAALAQRHFGAGMVRLKLPETWTSSPPALEESFFRAKDALLVLDDFKPTGDAKADAELHAKGEKVVRSIGNGAGRGKMVQPVSGGQSRAESRAPRCLILVTAEDLLRAESLHARLLILHLAKGATHWPRVTELQRLAGAGLFAQAMSGFLRWLAPRLDELERGVERRLEELRAAAFEAGLRGRSADVTAQLFLGLERFLAFAVEVGALDEEAVTERRESAWSVLVQGGAAQVRTRAETKPSTRFVSALRAALSRGLAHVAGKDGKYPRHVDPRPWGWRPASQGREARDLEDLDERRETWWPQGERIGWLSGKLLLLNRENAFALVQRVAKDLGDPLPVTPLTLTKALHEDGLLAATELDKRKTYEIRRAVQGRTESVLAFSPDLLGSEEAPDAESDDDDGPDTDKPSASNDFRGNVGEVGLFEGGAPLPARARRRGEVVHG